MKTYKEFSNESSNNKEKTLARLHRKLTRQEEELEEARVFYRTFVGGYILTAPQISKKLSPIIQRIHKTKQEIKKLS